MKINQDKIIEIKNNILELWNKALIGNQLEDAESLAYCYRCLREDLAAENSLYEPKLETQEEKKIRLQESLEKYE